MAATPHPQLAAFEPARQATSGRGPAVVLAVALAGLIAVLSFADRAPRLVRSALGALSGLLRVIENAIGVNLPDVGDIPYEWDVVGHFGLWSALAIASMWALRHRVPAFVLGVWLFAISTAVEVGQSYLTTTRTPDLRDLAANGFGIAFGLALALLARSAAVVTRRFRGPGPTPA